jgi:MFS superfamily sulfate permease-like transporter
VKLISNLITWIAAYFLVWWWKRNSHYDAPIPADAPQFVYKGKSYSYTNIEDLMSDRSQDA